MRNFAQLIFCLFGEKSVALQPNLQIKSNPYETFFVFFIPFIFDSMFCR